MHPIIKSILLDVTDVTPNTVMVNKRDLIGVMEKLNNIFFYFFTEIYNVQTEVKAIIVVRSYLKEKDIYVQSKQWKYKEPTIVKNRFFYKRSKKTKTT